MLYIVMEYLDNDPKSDFCKVRRISTKFLQAYDKRMFNFAFEADI